MESGSARNPLLACTPTICAVVCYAAGAEMPSAYGRQIVCVRACVRVRVEGWGVGREGVGGRAILRLLRHACTVASADGSRGHAIELTLNSPVHMHVVTVLDLESLHDAASSPTYIRYFIGPHALRKAAVPFLGGPMHKLPALYAAASPIEQIHADVPPMLLIHGDNDGTVPVSQSREMARALSAAGLEPCLIEVAGWDHFAMNGPVQAPGQETGQKRGQEMGLEIGQGGDGLEDGGRYHGGQSRQGTARAYERKEASHTTEQASGTTTMVPEAETDYDAALSEKQFVHEGEMMDFLRVRMRLPRVPDMK